MTNLLLPVRAHETEEALEALPSLLSPELALVDPDLAAVARMLLPDPVVLERPRPSSPPLRTAASPPVARPERAPAPAQRIPARRRRLAALVAIGLAALAAGALGFALTQNRGGAAETRARADASRAALQAQAASLARAARTYTWPAVPGAARYRLELRRGNAVVFETTTTQTVVELPRRLRLLPGRYSWSVTPRSENRGPAAVMRPVVEGTFQVASP